MGGHSGTRGTSRILAKTKFYDLTPKIATRRRSFIKLHVMQVRPHAKRKFFSSRCSFRGNIWSWTRMNVRKENENFQFRFNLTSIAFSVLRVIRTALHARNAFGERQKIVSSWNMRKLFIAKYLWASFAQVEGVWMIMKPRIEIFCQTFFLMLWYPYKIIIFDKIYKKTNPLDWPHPAKASQPWTSSRVG